MGKKLLHATLYKDLDAFDECIAECPEVVSFRNTHGETPIHFCVYDLEMTQRVVAAGFDVNAKTDSMQTALHMAAAAGQTDVIKYLIEQGVDVNVQCWSGASAAHTACKYGKLKALKILVDAGASIDKKTWRGSSPAHLAAKHGWVGTLKYLLVLGSPLNVKSYEFSGDGDTVLDLAVKRGVDQEVLTLIVHKGGKFCSLSNVKKGRSESGVSKETALFLRNEFEAFKIATKQQKREARAEKNNK